MSGLSIVFVLTVIFLRAKLKSSQIVPSGAGNSSLYRTLTDLSTGSEVKFHFFAPEGTTVSSDQYTSTFFSFEDTDHDTPEELAERLKRLDALRTSGAITQAEHDRERKRILGQV